MSTRHLMETAVTLIKDHLTTQMPLALADIRVTRGDAKVSTEPPRDYFIYEKAQGYRTPAVFIIGDETDFQKSQKGANHLNILNDIGVSVIIEDRDAEKLTLKAYRYQAALHLSLDQVQLTSADMQAKLTLVVRTASFSPLYSLIESKTGEVGSVFRKEVSLKIDCYQFEPL